MLWPGFTNVIILQAHSYSGIWWWVLLWRGGDLQLFSGKDVMSISLISPNTSAFSQTAAHMWKIIFEGVLDVCRLPLISAVPFIFAGLTKYTLSFEMVVVPKQTFVCLSLGATNESTRCLWCHDSEQGETKKQTKAVQRRQITTPETSVTLVKKEKVQLGRWYSTKELKKWSSIHFLYLFVGWWVEEPIPAAVGWEAGHQPAQR